MEDRKPDSPRPQRRTYMRKEMRREMIAAEASRIIAQKGLKNTTISDICTACGIAPRTLYLHFKSKQEILDLIVSGFGDKLSGIFDDAIDDNTGQSADKSSENEAYNFIRQKNYRLFKVVEENRDLLLILLKETSMLRLDTYDFFKTGIKRLLEIVRAEQRIFHKLGLIKPIDSRYSSQVIIGSMLFIIFNEILEGDCGDIEHLAEITTQLQFYGFGFPAKPE